jgi:uncharacterized protein YecE (DUF72 family)
VLPRFIYASNQQCIVAAVGAPGDVKHVTEHRHRANDNFDRNVGHHARNYDIGDPANPGSDDDDAGRDAADQVADAGDESHDAIEAKADGGTGNSDEIVQHMRQEIEVFVIERLAATFQAGGQDLGFRGKRHRTPTVSRGIARQGASAIIPVYGGYSSVAERRSVAADVVGSKPTSRPKLLQSLSCGLTLPRASQASHLESSSRLFAGTSGWAYPTWKPDFYPAGTPAKRFLEFYATQLTSVEVNYTFRALPTAKMLDGWLAVTPANFRFSFKAPQRITHFKRLRECEDDVAQLIAALGPIQQAGRLGLLLFQLPPNFKADTERLSGFLAAPALRTKDAPPIAFEFRHESWLTDEIYTILREHNAALCIAESNELLTPEVHTASGHTCYRLRRNGGYSTVELDAFAKRFVGLAGERDVYVYFKHEDEPTGALNATTFLERARAEAGKR